MNDNEAYEKLKAERPVIIHVLRRDFNNYPTAEMLAERTMVSSDSDELRQLIRQAAQYLHDNPDARQPKEVMP
jgi:hypothetical protein